MSKLFFPIDLFVENNFFIYHPFHYPFLSNIMKQSNTSLSWLSNSLSFSYSLLFWHTHTPLFLPLRICMSHCVYTHSSLGFRCLAFFIFSLKKISNVLCISKRKNNSFFLLFFFFFSAIKSILFLLLLFHPLV